MFFKAFVVITFSAAIVVLAAGSCRADHEDRLLERFKDQNQSGAAKLKQEVMQNLARAESPGHQEPDKLLPCLQDNLKRLQEDAHLPGDERLALISQVKERLRDLRLILEEKRRQELARETLLLETLRGNRLAEPTELAKKQAKVGQWAAVPSAASAQVTPVASPGRRWVRLGITGSFFMPLPGPLIPVQAAVPSIFFGPGRGVTVRSAISVPDGGSALLGGFSTSIQARNEFGAPVAGSVPYLSRGFRNTAFGRGISATGMSVGVRVISMEEEEQKLLAGR
jgi:hypothetical protein